MKYLLVLTLTLISQLTLAATTLPAKAARFKIICAQGELPQITAKLNITIGEENLKREIESVSAPTFSNVSQAAYRESFAAGACVTITFKEQK